MVSQYENGPDIQTPNEYEISRLISQYEELAEIIGYKGDCAHCDHSDVVMLLHDLKDCARAGS